MQALSHLRLVKLSDLELREASEAERLLIQKALCDVRRQGLGTSPVRKRCVYMLACICPRRWCCVTRPRVVKGGDGHHCSALAMVSQASSANTPVADCGPKRAAQKLQVRSVPLGMSLHSAMSLHRQAHLKEQGTDVALWTMIERNRAILGSCPRSLESVKSGIRCWRDFAVGVLRCRETQIFPPTLDGLLAWSSTFRCVWPGWQTLHCERARRHVQVR